MTISRDNLVHKEFFMFMDVNETTGYQSVKTCVTVFQAMELQSRQNFKHSQQCFGAEVTT